MKKYNVVLFASLILCANISNQSCHKVNKLSTGVNTFPIAADTKSVAVSDTRFFTLSATQTERQNTVNALNKILEEIIYPATLNQVSKIDQQQFNTWLQRSSLLPGTKEDLLVKLKPILSNQLLGILLLQGVKLKYLDASSDIMLVATPGNLLNEYNKTEIFIINAYASKKTGGFSWDNNAKYCEFKKCSDQVMGGPYCTLATVMNINCPKSTCTSDADCNPIIDQQGMRSDPAPIFTALNKF